MAFVNTRDTIGDQATVDGLVEHSLTELKEDGIGIVGTYACYKNTGLQSVELPGVSRINANAFNGCSNLEVVKLGGEGSSNSLSIAASAFSGCSKMKHLVIDRPAMATLASTSGLNGTQIALGEGAVYVPENLVATYKTNNNWKNYFITKLEKYPLSSFDTIEDSWADIFANSNYATDYAVGDTKTIEFTNGTKTTMVLAACNLDDKSDNSGKAKMTWISKNLIFSSNIGTSSLTTGWAGSNVRAMLINDVLPIIPTVIKDHIVDVKKSYRLCYPTDETLVSDDKIWIPSARELNHASGSSLYETSGCIYSDLFTNDDSRSKQTNSGTYEYWWTRTGSDSTMGHFMYAVKPGGGIQSYGGATTLHVCFGFCTD